MFAIPVVTVLTEIISNWPPPMRIMLPTSDAVNDEVLVLRCLAGGAPTDEDARDARRQAAAVEAVRERLVKKMEDTGPALIDIGMVRMEPTPATPRPSPRSRAPTVPRATQP